MALGSTMEPAALAQCVLTMDLAATAAGLVLHPAAWPDSGWHELAGLRQRYRLLLPTATTAALDAIQGPGRRSYVALAEECLRSRRYGSLLSWTTALAVGQPEWIERLLVPVPEGSRRLSSLAAADLPLDTPAPLLAITAGPRRSRDLVYAILRAARSPAFLFLLRPMESARKPRYGCAGRPYCLAAQSLLWERHRRHRHRRRRRQ